MATYTPPASLNNAADDPVTTTWGEAVVQNPIAISEGATGAPKVVPLGQGAPYLFSGNGSVTGLDNYDSCVIIAFCLIIWSTATSVSRVRYRLSNDNGSTWGSYVDVRNISLTASGQKSDFNEVVVDLTGYNAIDILGDTVNSASGSVARASTKFYGGAP